MSSYQYRKSHCGDKTILRPPYLHNWISYTGKTTYLYWIRAQGIMPSNNHQGGISYWDNLFQMTSCMQYMRFPVIAITAGLSLLFASAHTQSQCRTNEMCKISNTRAISTASMFISRKSIYRTSCAGVCSQYAKCIAATHDSATDICELHWDCEGELCITLTTRVASTVSMIKTPGIPCPKVRRKVIWYVNFTTVWC